MRRTERFDPEGSRYAFDFGLCTPRDGWAQVDTRQDAWYFGTWTNPRLRQIVSYCEGDITVECADDDAEYVEALRALHRWNVEAGHWKGIDTMCDEDIARAFERLELDDLLHRGDVRERADVLVHTSATHHHRFIARTGAARRFANAHPEGSDGTIGCNERDAGALVTALRAAGLRVALHDGTPLQAGGQDAWNAALERPTNESARFTGLYESAGVRTHCRRGRKPRDGTTLACRCDDGERAECERAHAADTKAAQSEAAHEDDEAMQRRHGLWASTARRIGSGLAPPDADAIAEGQAKAREARHALERHESGWVEQTYG